jgi:hypothetical protein
MKKATGKSDGKSTNGRKPQRKTNRALRFDLVRQAGEIERIFKEAVNHELSIHKRLGNPIATWRDGKVVIIPPEEIIISAEE